MGIVLAILVLAFLVTVGVVFFLKRSSFNAKAAEAAAGSVTETPTPAGFDNALYVTTSDKDAIVPVTDA